MSIAQTNAFEERAYGASLAWREQVEAEHAALTRWMELNPPRAHRQHYSIAPRKSNRLFMRALRRLVNLIT